MFPTPRFPLIVEALARLRSRSCIIDGEAVACGDDGIACFELIRRWDADDRVFMWAFDLIELNGIDLRHDPLGKRKAKLAAILARAAPGFRFNEHLEEEDGPLVFRHACKLGLEGIVSKRRDSPYSSGRSRHWSTLVAAARCAARRIAHRTVLKQGNLAPGSCDDPSASSRCGACIGLGYSRFTPGYGSFSCRPSN